MFMNLPINMIPRKQTPRSVIAPGAFYFAPRHQMCCLSGNTIENQGASLPKFPY